MAKVRNFTNFGVFVEIEEGVDGLIHISDLSWTKKIKHPAEFTSKGADIEVVVLEIDKGKPSFEPRSQTARTIPGTYSKRSSHSTLPTKVPSPTSTIRVLSSPSNTA